MSQSSAGGQETWQGEMLVLCLVAERVRRVAVGAGSLSPGGSRWAHGGVRRGMVRLLLGVGTQKHARGRAKGRGMLETPPWRCWSSHSWGQLSLPG